MGSHHICVTCWYVDSVFFLGGVVENHAETGWFLLGSAELAVESTCDMFNFVNSESMLMKHDCSTMLTYVPYVGTSSQFWNYELSISAIFHQYRWQRYPNLQATDALVHALVPEAVPDKDKWMSDCTLRKKKQSKKSMELPGCCFSMSFYVFLCLSMSFSLYDWLWYVVICCDIPFLLHGAGIFSWIEPP